MNWWNANSSFWYYASDLLEDVCIVCCILTSVLLYPVAWLVNAAYRLFTKKDLIDMKTNMGDFL